MKCADAGGERQAALDPPGRRREFFGLFLIACAVGHWLIVIMLSQISLSVLKCFCSQLPKGFGGTFALNCNCVSSALTLP